MPDWSCAPRLTTTLREQPNEFLTEARQANEAGRHGDALRSLYQGMAMMRNVSWLRRIAGEVSPTLQLHDPFLARLRQRLYVGKRDRVVPLVGGHLLRHVLHGFAAHSGNRSARSLRCARPACRCRYFPQTAPPSRLRRCGRMRPVGRTDIRKERSGVAMARQAALLLAYGIAVMLYVCSRALDRPSARFGWTRLRL